MVQGARLVSLQVAERDVAAALEGLSHSDKIAVLCGVLAEMAQRSGQPAVFRGLLHQALGERLGVAG